MHQSIAGTDRRRHELQSSDLFDGFDQHAPSKTTLKAWLLKCSVIFAIALAVRVWFNFGAIHYNAYNACDASEFLRSASVLAALPKNFSTAEMSLSAQEICHSGPMFPLFLAASYLICGHGVEYENWIIPVACHSFICALTCVLTAAVANIGWGTRVGLVAGLIGAIYPAFIVNSGRLYSESFAAFLLTLLAYAICKVQSIGLTGANSKLAMSWIFIGVIAACLQLTRPLMFIVTLSAFGASLLMQKRKLLCCAMLTLGCIAILMPWSLFQQFATGKSSVIVERFGQFHAFVGNDFSAMGFFSYPYPDVRSAEKKSVAKIIVDSIKSNPLCWITLTADKPVRLFKSPWNDFRIAIGPITYEWQVLFHQWLLVLSGIGFVFVTFEKGAGSLFARMYACSLIMIHAAYCLFVAVPRYNLTAMPFIIILSAAGLVFLLDGSFNGHKAVLGHRRHGLTATPEPNGRPFAFWSITHLCVALFVFVCVARMDASSFGALCAVRDGNFLVAVKAGALFWLLFAIWLHAAAVPGLKWHSSALALATAVILMPFVCLPLRAHGRPSEGTVTLYPGNNWKARFTLPAGASHNAFHFLAIDANSIADLDGVCLKVDGAPVVPWVIPGLSLLQDEAELKEFQRGKEFLEFEYLCNCLCRPSGISNAELRQWFLIPLTQIPSLIPSDKSKREGGATRKVETRARKNFIDVQISPLASPYTLYTCGGAGEKRFLPSLDRCSWDKAFYGVENDRGLTDIRLDERLDVEQWGSASRANVFVLSDTQDTSSKVVYTTSRPSSLLVNEDAAAKISIPDAGAGHSQSRGATYAVRISGVLKCNSDASHQTKLNPYVVFTGTAPGGLPRTYVTPWAPLSLEPGAFSFCCPIPAAVFDGGPQTVEISHCEAPTSGLCNRHIRSEWNLDNLRVETISMPINPLKYQWRIAPE